MIIEINDNHDIVSVSTYCKTPYVDEYNILIDEKTVSPEVLCDIFSYRYIDGEFVRKPNVDDNHLSSAKAIKIEFLSETCKRMIHEGIDWNDEHYSLTDEDQINLSKLASQAVMYPQLPIFYHPDNGLCRQYTVEEILALSQMCVGWVTYHTTYFNFAKAFVNSLTDFDQVVSFDYGSTITDETLAEQMNVIIQTTGIDYHDTIHDLYNYDVIKNPTKSDFKDFFIDVTPEDVTPV